MNIEEAIKQLEGCRKISVAIGINAKTVYENGEIYIWSNMRGRKSFDQVSTNMREQATASIRTLVELGLINKEGTKKQRIEDLEIAARNFKDFLASGEDDGVPESALGDLFHHACTPDIILELIRAYNEPKYYPPTA